MSDNTLLRGRCAVANAVSSLKSAGDMSARRRTDPDREIENQARVLQSVAAATLLKTRPATTSCAVARKTIVQKSK